MTLLFDKNKNAIINPIDCMEKIENMPDTVVTFFETKLLDFFLKEFDAVKIGETDVACKAHPIYKINYKGKEIAVVQAGVGAPYCVRVFEEVCAMGAKNVLMFGSCGTLYDFKEASIIIPNCSVRDEGTSFHYAKASQEINLTPKYVKRLIDFFDNAGVENVVGKNWTTDAFFRETKSKVRRRIKQGCISVDMESSAMVAFARFRGINFSQFFYAADSLAKKQWDSRILNKKHNLCGEEKALYYALELATTLFDDEKYK